MNHSLCCKSHIWNLTLSINVLNLWSKSQTKYVGSYLIYLISIMYYNLDFGFLNSYINLILILSSIFYTTSTGTRKMHVRVQRVTSQSRDHLCFLYVFILDLLHSPYGFIEKPMFLWVLQPISIKYRQLNVCSIHYVNYWNTWEKTFDQWDCLV